MTVIFQHKDNVSEEKNESRAAIYVVWSDHSPLVLTEKETSEQEKAQAEKGTERDWEVQAGGNWVLPQKDMSEVKKVHEFPVSALKSKEERGWEREGSKTCTVLPTSFSRI